ncbi:MAG: HSP20 family small heat-shock protein [Woeseiaceae bacterium]|nr:HSP20 family small heat-shock protein [Woeseiaceae bacterium]
MLSRPYIPIQAQGRRFTLPETADADGITASSHNGILEVAIPTLPQVKARRITVVAA